MCFYFDLYNFFFNTWTCNLTIRREALAKIALLFCFKRPLRILPIKAKVQVLKMVLVVYKLYSDYKWRKSFVLATSPWKKVHRLLWGFQCFFLKVFSFILKRSLMIFFLISSGISHLINLILIQTTRDLFIRIVSLYFDAGMSPFHILLKYKSISMQKCHRSQILFKYNSTYLQSYIYMDYKWTVT